MREPSRAAHVKAVWAATGLGVVFYNRANATIGADALAELADSCPNLVGFKDGVGDIELMTRVYARFGDRFTHVGGLPTAETFALPYLQLGVTLDRAGLDRAHALYVEHGLGARDDAAAMQYFFDGWTFDPKRPAFVR